MGLRRTARECALQMLYQFDIGGQSARDIPSTFWDRSQHPATVRSFANQLFEGSVGRLDEIDEIIRRHVKHWKLGRIAAVDRNILRMAVFEFISDAGIPETVVINEALEIAKKFSTDESAQFVNGVLDSIKTDLDPQIKKGTH